MSQQCKKTKQEKLLIKQAQLQTLFRWLEKGATLMLVKCDLCFFFFFFNLKFNTSNFSCAYCMWRTKFSLTKQKKRKQSFCCQRGTLSQCMTYQTRKWQVKHNERQNTVIIKTFFPGLQSEIYSKTERITPREHISWGFICFCENKALGMNLFMQFAYSHTTVLAYACYC